MEKPSHVEVAAKRNGDHPYHQRRLGCPCPAVATMINHSYLTPKDADDQISIISVCRSLRECYNFSWFFSIIFAILATLRLGKLFGFSIRELRQHGKIEHDASITRFDVAKGNALDPDLGLIESFFNSIANQSKKNSSPEQLVVTLEDYAKKRVELESKLERFDFQSKWEIDFLGRGEACLALQVHRAPPNMQSMTGVDKATPVAHAEWLRVWYAEEKLAFDLGWHKPSQSIGLFGTLRLVSLMKRIQKRYVGRSEKGH